VKGDGNTEKRIKKRTAVLAFLAVVFTAVLAVSLYKAFSVYFTQRQEQSRFSEYRRIVNRDESVKEYNPAEKYAPLRESNGDFRGWLTLPDTGIDYPVVMPPANDPQFYLHRDFDRNYSYSGTPFIGEGCDENSDIFIIYGHNMKTGSMFGTLDKYADGDWAAEHRDIIFETPEGRRVYRVFAALRTKVNSENEYRYFDSVGNFGDEEYYSIVSEMLEKSEIDSGGMPQGRAQILILSTCSYHTENGRFAVMAYRTE
jgi:sortase B